MRVIRGDWHIDHSFFNFQSRIKLITYTSIFTTLTAIGAFIKIPLPYVPLTLQTFFVLLAGNFLGSKNGMISQILYLAIGLAGLPVFAYGGGPGYVFHPTFGYLISYPIAAYIAGMVNRIDINEYGEQKIIHNASFYKIIMVNFLSVLTIFVIGVGYLYYLNMKIIIGKQFSFDKALWTGFLIFLPGDLVKVILSAYIYMKLKYFQIK